MLVRVLASVFWGNDCAPHAFVDNAHHLTYASDVVTACPHNTAVDDSLLLLPTALAGWVTPVLLIGYSATPVILTFASVAALSTRTTLLIVVEVARKLMAETPAPVEALEATEHLSPGHATSSLAASQKCGNQILDFLLPADIFEPQATDR